MTETDYKSLFYTHTLYITHLSHRRMCQHVTLNSHSSSWSRSVVSRWMYHVKLGVLTLRSLLKGASYHSVAFLLSLFQLLTTQQAGAQDKGYFLFLFWINFFRFYVWSAKPAYSRDFFADHFHVNRPCSSLCPSSSISSRLLYLLVCQTSLLCGAVIVSHLFFFRGGREPIKVILVSAHTADGRPNCQECIIAWVYNDLVI